VDQTAPITYTYGGGGNCLSFAPYNS
jgi:hypothetical protein